MCNVCVPRNSQQQQRSAEKKQSKNTDNQKEREKISFFLIMNILSLCILLSVNAQNINTMRERKMKKKAVVKGRAKTSYIWTKNKNATKM